jgi:hypothetical protein
MLSILWVPKLSPYLSNNNYRLAHTFKFKLFCDRLPSGAHYQMFITVSHLQSSRCEAPSLMRGRVCNLLLQFVVTLQSKSRRTHNHILVSFETARFSFCSLLRLAVLFSGGILTHLHTSYWLTATHSKLKLYYDRQSVGQSVLVSCNPSWARDKFVKFFFLTVAGLLMWGALSDERAIHIQCGPLTIII